MCPVSSSKNYHIRNIRLSREDTIFLKSDWRVYAYEWSEYRDR